VPAMDAATTLRGPANGGVAAASVLCIVDDSFVDVLPGRSIAHFARWARRRASVFRCARRRMSRLRGRLFAEDRSTPER
jgi:hypothetical protein